MSYPNLAPVLFSNLAMQIPTLLVCVVALFIIGTGSDRASRASMWAFMGFGLVLALCFIIPITQAVVQAGAMRYEGESMRVQLLTWLSMLWSVLRAVSYGLLLMAVLARRSASPVN